MLQEHVDDAVRGRIMALWVMAFGGFVPLGVLAGGYLVKVTSITAVLLVGAVVAVALVDPRRLDALARIGRRPRSRRSGAGLTAGRR